MTLNHSLVYYYYYTIIIIFFSLNVKFFICNYSTFYKSIKLIIFISYLLQKKCGLWLLSSTFPENKYEDGIIINKLNVLSSLLLNTKR